MPDKPREITQPKLLIGEGQEEVRFFNALLKHLGRQDVQVENYSGKDQLRTRLKFSRHGQAFRRSLHCASYGTPTTVRPVLFKAFVMRCAMPVWLYPRDHHRWLEGVHVSEC